MKRSNLFIVFILSVFIVKSQNINELSSIFSESYTYESEGKIEEAIDTLLSIYDEVSYEVNLRLGWLYYNNGNYPESQKYYLKARKLMPYAFEAKLGYVLPVAAMGNWGEVIEIYKDILKRDPQNTLVNYRMGAIYYERGEFEKAFQYAEKVVNLYPFDYDSVLLLAWINLKMGKYREARILFEKSLLIKPDNDSAIEGLALIK